MDRTHSEGPLPRSSRFVIGEAVLPVAFDVTSPVSASTAMAVVVVVPRSIPNTSGDDMAQSTIPNVC
jgi:hypothetical protein